MHVRVRIFGKPDSIVVVESKLTKIDKFRRIIQDKFNIDPKLQRLFYGGKLLENGYTFHDYNIKLNDVIQLMVQTRLSGSPNSKTNGAANKKPTEESVTEYEDAQSTLYAVGDLIDMRDREYGCWLEGEITRIVYNPDIPRTSVANHSRTEEALDKSDIDHGSIDQENDVENNSPNKSADTVVVCDSTEKAKNKGIARYFSPTTKKQKKRVSVEKKVTEAKLTIDDTLFYKVQLDGDEEDSNFYCKLNEIRPRARTVINIEELQGGELVMLNYNTEHPMERGDWYDFKISEIINMRFGCDVVGTLYLGPDAIPQNDTRVHVTDKIFAIEPVVPIADRTDEYYKKIEIVPEKRSQPLNCLSCRDRDNVPCNNCGCFLCSGKDFPEKIVLCDECNRGYHMICLEPPLTEVPEEDWYCPSCKRDTNEVIAPGAAKQVKKSTTTKRDWGRGMACVGGQSPVISGVKVQEKGGTEKPLSNESKTKSCAMPPNHFGPIPGIEVGMCWRFRIQLSETGVHRPPVSGIHGRDEEGAYSIVLSGGYEDDVDNGNEFTYTGSGGRDLSGNKRTAEQSCDQTLTRENKALARNCAVKEITEKGGDAGDNWREGKPVRVVRSCKMMKHFPKFAPKEGIRYDGIYKVVKYYPEKGLSGFRVWKYLLRRDDPNPAPWEPGSKVYPIIYPDGYLEAEAEKKALKEKNKGKAVGKAKGKKRSLANGTTSTDSDDDSVPVKKTKTVSIGFRNERKLTTKRTRDSTESEDKDTSDDFSPAEVPPVKKKRKMVFNGSAKKKLLSKSPKEKAAVSVFLRNKNKDMVEEDLKSETESALTAEEREAILSDTLNVKLWNECLIVAEARGKKEFVEFVSATFLCIICQDVAASPVTTPCLHNFCLSCIKLAFKSTSAQCPCCRQSLGTFEVAPNEKLTTALRSIMPGYDAGKK